MKILGDIDLSEGGEITNATIAFGSNFPNNPNTGELFYKSGAGLYVYSGTEWVTYASKAGDTFTGSVSLPKASGEGLKVEGTYGWRDITGEIVPLSSGSDAPTLATFIGTIRAFAYVANDEGDATFHIPHDYAPGTNIYLHVHWGHNGTSIADGIIIDIKATYAKGHNQAVFTTPVTHAVNASSLNITNTPQYVHRTDEIQLTSDGGGSSMLDTALVEPDGIVLVNYKVSTLPTITGSASLNAPFIFNIDLHYQSTNMATKNKTPSFYA